MCCASRKCQGPRTPPGALGCLWAHWAGPACTALYPGRVRTLCPHCTPRAPVVPGTWFPLELLLSPSSQVRRTQRAGARARGPACSPRPASGRAGRATPPGRQPDAEAVATAESPTQCQHPLARAAQALSPHTPSSPASAHPGLLTRTAVPQTAAGQGAGGSSWGSGLLSPGPCPSPAGQPRPSSLSLLARPCGPGIPSPPVPLLKVWALPRLPLGLHDGTQPESRTPGKDPLRWPPGPSPHCLRHACPYPEKSAARES